MHLGCTRYQLAESPRDFFDAWMDVLRRYAVGSKVDFVIICGDFFHKKSVPPETMNYAFEGLSYLKDNRIPTVMIEGNHDQKHTDSEYSWLRSLAKWDLVYLLEPNLQREVRDERHERGASDRPTITYTPWNAEARRGGFIDIGRARIFGSNWYGASGNWAIPMLADAIGAHRRKDAFHILMLHTDVEGYQVHPVPALELSALRQLRSVTDYVGLGHTHQHYEIDGWAFNPGSIEVTNISEYRETRGVFVVDVADDNSFTYEHLTEYHHRPFQRLAFDVTPFSDPKDLTAAMIDHVKTTGRVAEPGLPAPIIEISLRGQLGFPNSLIEMQKIRDATEELTGALHVRIRNHSVPIDIGETIDADEDEGRERIERRVVDLLVARDKRFAASPAAVADAVIGAKRMALSDEEPEKIAEFIAIQAAKV